MNNRLQAIGRNTLLPVGIVAALVMATWTVATDRQEAVGQIAINTVRIDRHEGDVRELRAKLQYVTEVIGRLEVKLQYVTEALGRLEVKLGTVPRD